MRKIGHTKLNTIKHMLIVHWTSMRKFHDEHVKGIRAATSPREIYAFQLKIQQAQLVRRN